MSVVGWVGSGNNFHDLGWIGFLGFRNVLLIRSSRTSGQFGFSGLHSGVGTMGTWGYIVPPSSGLVPRFPPKSKMRLVSKF